MINTVTDLYQNRISQIELKLIRLSKLFNLIYAIRLFSFIGFVAFLIWFTVSPDSLLLVSIASIFLILFLVAIKVDGALIVKQRDLNCRLKVNQRELQYLAYNFQGFGDGKEYVNLNPALANDFDLFGDSSFYQYLNRSVTKVGRDRFANRLLVYKNVDSHIKDYQEAIAELAEAPQFLETYQSLGVDIHEKGDEYERLLNWASESGQDDGWIKVLLCTYPFVLLLLIGLYSVGVLPSAIVLLPLFFSFWVTRRKGRIINRMHDELGKNAKIFSVFERIIAVVENGEFNSKFLKEISGKFKKGDKGAVRSLNQLYRILEWFDYRYNMVVSVLLNTLVLYDLLLLVRLERWRNENRGFIADYFVALSEFDALIGFVRFAMNNKGSVVYPEVLDDDFIFETSQMGHPLIVPESRVNNDISFSGKPIILVITGANMAGKSTFLRTMVVNLILAMSGAPVCASHFRFTPCAILSSINIRDSLSQKASYFYAELLRIREIIESVKRNPRSFVVLDEILRGTNTKDKQTGSLGLLEKFIAMNAVVVIATHDLVIGELENKYPDIVLNRCFEVELEDDELVFDYKLKHGISQKINASVLMRKIGIID